MRQQQKEAMFEFTEGRNLLLVKWGEFYNDAIIRGDKDQQSHLAIL